MTLYGSRYDDNTLTLPDIGFNFYYNGTNSRSKIYVGGNSWVGFGSSQENLKINRRDASCNNLYNLKEQENGRDIFRIRWEGNSNYSWWGTNDLVWELILYDDNTMVLIIEAIPNSGTNSFDTKGSVTSLILENNKSYVMFPNSELGKNYTIQEGSYRQTTVKYLIDDGVNGIKAWDGDTWGKVSDGSVTESMMMNFGCELLPPDRTGLILTNPILLFWTDDFEVTNKKIETLAIPTPKMVRQNTDYSISNGIKNIRLTASITGDSIIKVACSYDLGENWWSFYNYTWTNISLEELSNKGMAFNIINAITTTQWDYLVHDKQSIKCIYYIYSKIKGSRSSSYYSAPFQNIVLTSYSGDESADTPYYKGELIGYTDKGSSYSGSDILKGTINTAETKLGTEGDGVLHFVFDFPTHVANGSFQSIWWIGDITTSSSKKEEITVVCPCTRTDAIAGGSNYYVGKAMTRSADKRVCILGEKSTSSYTGIFYPKYELILNDDFTFYKYIDISGKVSTSITNTFCGWGASDNGIVIINAYSTTNNLAIIDIDIGQVQTLSLNTSNIGDQYVNVNIRGNKVYISGNKFSEYVINGGALTLVRDYGKATSYFFSDFNDSVAFLSEDKRICYLNNNMVKATPIIVDTVSTQRHLKYRSDNNEIGYTLEQIKQDGANVTLTIGKYSIGTYVGAQTLLAALVTKTPTNTILFSDTKNIIKKVGNL